MTLRARLLEQLAPWRAAPAWRVALSGGLDSTVLLHALVQLAQRESLPPISAIHIHHGLQAAADAWPEHCRALCAGLHVPLEVVYVQVEDVGSLEQRAREARYQAFTERLGAGEVMFVAQHRDDQAETLLFRLVRGAGVQGLAAMPVIRPLGAGHLVRPLLGFSRAELQEYADEHGLHWVEDPSNSDEHFSRNYLRQQVLPQLAKRWPQVSMAMARSAAHQAEAGELLDELAAIDLLAAAGSSGISWLGLPSLNLEVLRGLSEARQRNALRFWLRPFTRMPDSVHWAGWVALRDADADAVPVWRLHSGELRRTGGHLWWLSGCWLQPVAEREWPVRSGQILCLPGNGRVELGELPNFGHYTVGYRRPGEVVDVSGRGRRDLKRLLNELRIPAFVRDRLPLLRRDGAVVAIANVPQLRSIVGEGGTINWIPPTSDQGLS
jgi:tRNA(Ile)-lysidine synthase